MKKSNCKFLIKTAVLALALFCCGFSGKYSCQNSEYSYDMQISKEYALKSDSGNKDNKKLTVYVPLGVEEEVPYTVTTTAKGQFAYLIGSTKSNMDVKSVQVKGVKFPDAKLDATKDNKLIVSGCIDIPAISKSGVYTNEYEMYLNDSYITRFTLEIHVCEHDFENDDDKDCGICGYVRIAPNDQKAADAVTELINNLPVEAGLDDEKTVADVREAYENLTDDQKALISDETVAKLEDAEEKVEAAIAAKKDEEEAKKEADQKAADEVAELINNLPDEAGLEDEQAVKDAREAYENLTDDQKALISDETVAKLEDAEKKVEEAIEAEEAKKAEEEAKKEADQKAADEVAELINNLPDEAGLEDEQAVKDAREAYENLTDDQKALISDETVAKLEDAEKKVEEAKALNTPTPTANPTADPTAEPTLEPTPSADPTTEPKPTSFDGGAANITPVVEPATITPIPTAEPTPDAELSVGDFINRCYEVALNREPDEAGFEYWVNNLNNGLACGAQVGYGFIFSEEYTNRNKTNEEYVTDLYNMYFGREADTEGFNYWLAKLEAGESRESVFAGFANSVEFYNLCMKYQVVSGWFAVGVPTDRQGGVNCFVARLYKVCLDRLPDQEGQAYWTSLLLGNVVSGSSCASGFIFSQEFAEKGLSNEAFICYMYRAFFGREADQEGLTYWFDKMENGATANDVFAGFAGSEEFTNLCANYGIIA